MPGRKTDVKDSEWIGLRFAPYLLRHGLLRASFIPDAAQRDLRELTRYRTTLVRERASTINYQPFAEGAGRRQHQAGGSGSGY